MPPLRRKSKSTAETKCVKQADYDNAILALKTTLKITPKTAKHFYGMGYTTPEALAPKEITPELLEVQMQDYLERTGQTFKTAPKRSGAMYRVAFRRILWTARATDKERQLYPEKMTCEYWSNKAIAAREAKSLSHGKRSIKGEEFNPSTEVTVA